MSIKTAYAPNVSMVAGLAVRGPFLQAINQLEPALAQNVDGDVITFDFGPRLPSGVTIISINAININGIGDGTPTLRLNGQPTIVPSPSTNLANQAVTQGVFNLIGGVSYFIQCVAVCSDGAPRSIEAAFDCMIPAI